LIHSSIEYVPGDVKNKISVERQKVVVLTDSKDEGTNLGRMLSQFTRIFFGGIEVIDLNEVDIKGGCLGCIQCGYDNSCQYGDKDSYVEFFSTTVKSANILVLAGSIKDRYLSSRWKLFFDRSFFNNHVPVMTDKQLGFIISGPLSQIPNLKADQNFYKKNGLYDFPQKDYKSRITNSMMMLLNRIPSIRKEIYTKRMKTEMIKPLQKVLERK